MTATTIDSILDLAIEIQQIPAPTFSEASRAGYVEDKFREEGLLEVEQDSLGNVSARLPGTQSGPPLVIAAHLDTVFPIETNLDVRQTIDRIYGPGIGDNSLGVAGLFGLIWELRLQNVELPNDLLLVGTVGEEGLGNSQGMRAVVERYGSQALAYIALEGMALGYIFNRGMGARRFAVRYRTKGGHSWVNYGSPSAIHEISRLITRLTELQLPESPRTSWNAGVIQGGTSVNTIASEATVQIDLRSENELELARLESEVTRAVYAVPRTGVEVEIDLIGDRPHGLIPADHPFVQLAENSLKAVGIEPRLSIGSTDASIPLHYGFPAVCIGLTTGSGTHSEDEYINISPLPVGIEQLIRVVTGVHSALS